MTTIPQPPPDPDPTDDDETSEGFEADEALGAPFHPSNIEETSDSFWQEQSPGIAHSRQIDNEPLQADRVRCPVCGRESEAGKECLQCGTQLPGLASTPGIKHSNVIQAVLVSIANGRCITVPVDHEIIIGRESTIPAIGEALSGYEYVSRHHCSIVIDSASKFLTIRDNGSTNGTFIGEQRQRVTEPLTVSMPVLIHLGSFVSLTISAKD